MLNQKLNDREEQVCIAALFYFLQHINFWSRGKKYYPINEQDILDPGHSKAHIITAIQKLSGQPITHAFQNPNPSTLQSARTRVFDILTKRGFSAQEANDLFAIATLQK